MLNRPFVVVVVLSFLVSCQDWHQDITFKAAQLDKTYYNINPHFEILAFDVSVLSHFGSISIGMSHFDLAFFCLLFCAVTCLSCSD